jgi:hypothetical protein
VLVMVALGLVLGIAIVADRIRARSRSEILT